MPRTGRPVRANSTVTGSGAAVTQGHPRQDQRAGQGRQDEGDDNIVGRLARCVPGTRPECGGLAELGLDGGGSAAIVPEGGHDCLDTSKSVTGLVPFSSGALEPGEAAPVLGTRTNPSTAPGPPHPMARPSEGDWPRVRSPAPRTPLVADLEEASIVLRSFRSRIATELTDASPSRPFTR